MVLPIPKHQGRLLPEKLAFKLSLRSSCIAGGNHSQHGDDIIMSHDVIT